jgi:hypothetical protein
MVDAGEGVDEICVWVNYFVTYSLLVISLDWEQYRVMGDGCSSSLS